MINLIILEIIALLILLELIYTYFVKPLWEQKWFFNSVTYLNDHWAWWKTYIYGRAKNMEDFVRNPAEVLRETYFPFCIKNIVPISVLNLRLFYKQYNLDKVEEYVEFVKKDAGIDIDRYTYHKVAMGQHNVFRLGKGDWTYLDLRALNPFETKYCNSLIFLQFVASMKWKVIPIPYIALCIRYSKKNYFQFGFGWGPERPEGADPNSPYITSLCAKFRFTNFKSEQAWNPSDVYGFYEGTV